MIVSLGAVVQVAAVAGPAFHRQAAGLRWTPTRHLKEVNKFHTCHRLPANTTQTSVDQPSRWRRISPVVMCFYVNKMDQKP